MKRVLFICVVLLVMGFLFSCSANKKINYSEISYIDIGVDNSPYEAYGFIFDKKTMKATTIHYLMGAKFPMNEQWTEEKFNSFINGLEKCNLEKWTGDYIEKDIFDGFRWNIDLKNNDVSILSIKGHNRYPDIKEWNKFIDLIAQYVSPELAQYKK